MPLTILIADDHPLLVDGVKNVLKEMEDVEVFEPVGNGRLLLSRLREAPVDVLLLDLQMPLMDGLEVLKQLKIEFPRIKVLVFTNYNQPKLIREARDLGARGYLLKNSPSSLLKQALRTVADGGVWFREEEATQASNESELFIDDFMRKYQITQREIEIIRLIARGHTTREIGAQLYVSEFTINAHRRNICRKLDIYTPAGLVNFAKEQGLA